MASLSRLDLTEDERESFRRQLSSILEYVGQLAEVEVGEVEPMSHSVPLLNVLREDAAAGCPDDVRQAIVDAFPEGDSDLLKVQAIFS